MQNTSAAYSADLNGDGKIDYAVFIEFAGQKKLVLFIRSESSYRIFRRTRSGFSLQSSPLTETVKTKNKIMEKKFFKNLPENFSVPKDAFGLKILKEYGALFVARRNAVVPKNVIFKDHEEVSKFQESLNISREIVGRFEIELQTVAMNALKNAIAEAAGKGLTITTRDYDAGRRSYGETVGLWYSRVEPALEFWTAKRQNFSAGCRPIENNSAFRTNSRNFQTRRRREFFSARICRNRLCIRLRRPELRSIFRCSP